MLALRTIPALEPAFDLRLTDKAAPVDGDPRYRQADITDFRAVAALMPGMQAVAHLAIASEREYRGAAATADGLDPFAETMLQVNVQGTYHVFEAARRAGVRKIVYLSSMTAHLGNKHREHYDQNTPVEPKNLYACTKLFGENLARVYARDHGISVICLRIGQPYPLGTEYDNFWREGKRQRSIYVTIEDIAQSILRALETDVPFGVYHIVSASDNPRVDLSHAREIGYVPRGYFSGRGLSFHEHGDYPDEPIEIVTH